MRISTPEGVELELTLAGLGSRFIAATIDHIIKFLAIGLLALVLFSIGDVGYAVFIPLSVLIFFGYDILFEVLSQGRTPGKQWNDLRVVRTGGAPVDIRASAIRNILRLVDEWTISFIPGVVSILTTKRNQRVGDLAADTVVVRERPRVAQAPVAVAPSAPAGWVRPSDAPAGPSSGTPDWDVSAVTAEDLSAIREFLDRRSSLPGDVRQRVGGQIADAVAPRVGGAPESIDRERFLEGVAAAKLARSA